MNTFNLYFQVLADYGDFVRAFFTVTNDRAILPCNAWTNLDLGHGLHVNKRGRMRFINSHAVRSVALRRQLALNLETATAHERTGESPI
jgi:hypothetical protein